MKSPHLDSLIGEIITIKIPTMKAKEFEAKLLGIEHGGIWIEDIGLSQSALAAARTKATPKTMIFFVPFSSIAFVVDSLDAPTLSETFLTE